MGKFDSTNLVTGITSSLGFIFTAVTESTLYQIVVMILTVCGLMFNIAYTAWKWYRHSKKDGKITEEEVDHLFDELNDIKKTGDEHGKK